MSARHAKRRYGTVLIKSELLSSPEWDRRVSCCCCGGGRDTVVSSASSSLVVSLGPTGPTQSSFIADSESNVHQIKQICASFSRKKLCFSLLTKPYSSISSPSQHSPKKLFNHRNIETVSKPQKVSGIFQMVIFLSTSKQIKKTQDGGGRLQQQSTKNVV